MTFQRGNPMDYERWATDLILGQTPLPPEPVAFYRCDPSTSKDT